jgi:hypothetical protein
VFARLVLLVMLCAMTGCQTMTPIGGTDTSCLAYEPIRYSRQDSAETIGQIRRHNAAFDALCRGSLIR